MNITKERFASHVKHKDQHAWFDKKFPSGEANYQRLIDELVDSNKINIAQYLLNCIGKDDSVTDHASIPNEKIGYAYLFRNLFIVGDFYASNSVIVDRVVHCGGSVRIKGNLETNGDITVNGCLIVEGNIRINRGNIYAESIGVEKDILITSDETLVVVYKRTLSGDRSPGNIICKTKPLNLLEGNWISNQKQD